MKFGFRTLLILAFSLGFILDVLIGRKPKFFEKLTFYEISDLKQIPQSPKEMLRTHEVSLEQHGQLTQLQSVFNFRFYNA